MKEFFKYLALPLCLLCAGFAQKRENWILEFSTLDGNMYYDANSIRDSRGLKIVAAKGTMPTNSKENLSNARQGKPLMTRSTAEIRIDCRAKTTQFANVTVYYADGHQFHWPAQAPERIPVSSHADYLYKLACK